MAEDLRQRQPRVEDRKFIAFVRTKPCCNCGHAAPSHAAHIRMASRAHKKRQTGKAERPSDRWAVPLCSLCHLDGPSAQHKVGEAGFWRVLNVDPFIIAKRLWAEYEAHGGVMVETPAERRPKQPGEKYWRKKRQLQRAWPRRKLRGASRFPRGRKIQNRRR